MLGWMLGFTAAQAAGRDPHRATHLPACVPGRALLWGRGPLEQDGVPSRVFSTGRGPQTISF